MDIFGIIEIQEVRFDYEGRVGHLITGRMVVQSPAPMIPELELEDNFR